jgi:hypothetical protein
MRNHICIQNFVHKVVGQRFLERPDEIGCEDEEWVQPAQDKFQGWDGVNLSMNLQILKLVRNFLIN